MSARATLHRLPVPLKAARSAPLCKEASLEGTRLIFVDRPRFGTKLFFPWGVGDKASQGDVLIVKSHAGCESFFHRFIYMHISEKPMAGSTSRDRQGLDMDNCHAQALDDILEARSGTNCCCVLHILYCVLCEA